MKASEPAFVADCAAIVGDANVLLGRDETRPYSVDFWNQYRGAAGAVARPGTTGEVARLVRLAARHGVAIVPQSGNTGLVHGGIPDETGSQLVLSLQRLDRIRRLDAANDTMTVEAGCVLAAVQEAAAGVDRLFPLSLGAEGSCRIGGNLSQCGRPQRAALRHGARLGARPRSRSRRRQRLRWSQPLAQGQYGL